jgi:hypothetical protein
MKEPYVEGIANHDDPESWVGAREDADQALTGARAGWALSREIRNPRAPTLLSHAAGHTTSCVNASPRSALRGQRPHARTESSCAEAGRSSHCPRQMVRRAASGRPEATRR